MRITKQVVIDALRELEEHKYALQLGIEFDEGRLESRHFYYQVQQPGTKGGWLVIFPDVRGLPDHEKMQRIEVWARESAPDLELLDWV